MRNPASITNWNGTTTSGTGERCDICGGGFGDFGSFEQDDQLLCVECVGWAHDEAAGCGEGTELCQHCGVETDHYDIRFLKGLRLCPECHEAATTGGTGRVNLSDHRGGDLIITGPPISYIRDYGMAPTEDTIIDFSPVGGVPVEATGESVHPWRPAAGDSELIWVEEHRMPHAEPKDKGPLPVQRFTFGFDAHDGRHPDREAHMAMASELGLVLAGERCDRCGNLLAFDEDPEGQLLGNELLCEDCCGGDMDEEFGDEDDEDYRYTSNIKMPSNARYGKGAPPIENPQLTIDLREGDALKVLRTLPSDSVDCVISSPPYPGVFDYGNGTWKGGRKNCSHQPKSKDGRLTADMGDDCPLGCGAKRATRGLGMELSLKEFISNLCDIYDEVRRVLKPGGSLWVNFGDKFNAKNGAWGIPGIQERSLLNVPGRFAIEMTDNRGWCHHNNIIWKKPGIRTANLQNRFHVDYESFMFFTKGPRAYFEPVEVEGKTKPWRQEWSVWEENLGKNACGRQGAFPEALVERPILATCPPGGVVMDIFMGSGTTGIVAAHYGRSFIGIELDQKMLLSATGRFLAEGYDPKVHHAPAPVQAATPRIAAGTVNTPAKPATVKSPSTPAPGASFPVRPAKKRVRPSRSKAAVAKRAAAQATEARTTTAAKTKRPTRRKRPSRARAASTSVHSPADPRSGTSGPGDPRRSQPKAPARMTVGELFAGVGGLRLGLARGGWHTVFSNQWEPGTRAQHASECYVHNFGAEGHHNEDITTLLDRGLDDMSIIPELTLLCGGFPCVDWSVAKPLAHSKGLQGDKGQLWWQVHRLVEHRRPPLVLLENVDRLLKSPAQQRGRDFAVILRSLTDLGYAVEWRIVNAADYGFPQRRRRVFIIATDTRVLPVPPKFDAADAIGRSGVLARALPVAPVAEDALSRFSIDGTLDEVGRDFGAGLKRSPFLDAGVAVGNRVECCEATPNHHGPVATLGGVLLPERLVPEQFFIDAKKLPSWRYLKGAKRKDRTRPDGSTWTYSEGPVGFPDATDGPCRTLLTSEGGSSASRTTHVIRRGRRLRRLTPVELERLNGFPDDWTKLQGDGLENSDAKRGFLMGNALVVGLVERIGAVLAADWRAHLAATAPTTAAGRRPRRKRPSRAKAAVAERQLARTASSIRIRRGGGPDRRPPRSTAPDICGKAAPPSRLGPGWLAEQSEAVWSGLLERVLEVQGEIEDTYEDAEVGDDVFEVDLNSWLPRELWELLLQPRLQHRDDVRPELLAVVDDVVLVRSETPRDSSGPMDDGLEARGYDGGHLFWVNLEMLLDEDHAERCVHLWLLRQLDATPERIAAIVAREFPEF